MYFELETLRDHLEDVTVDGNTIGKRNLKTYCLTPACELY